MAHRLHVCTGSHPCETVKRALELKGIPYRLIELPPPLHAPVQRVLFGRRSVPALRLEGGEKLVGSRPILRRLDELVPDPPLLPADANARSAVLRAEEWGDQVLQPLARRILWRAIKRRPVALHSFQAGSRLPALPRPAVRLAAPAVVLIEKALHGANDDAARADLRALPGHLDRVDRWIAEGVLGGDAPNAADLQIAPSLALLGTIGDVRPLMDGRPGTALGQRLFGDYAGDVPAGAFPADWVPSPAAAAAA